ncbi:MAG: hypothetical protein LBK99_15550 [Opitutaceae bacterium]|nr:hypothetical protein [Opitutaceae bacterium]
MLATAILIYRCPPHDPDGVGVDLSGQGREPKPETPSRLPPSEATVEAFLREGIERHKRLRALGVDISDHRDTEGTPI